MGYGWRRVISYRCISIIINLPVTLNWIARPKVNRRCMTKIRMSSPRIIIIIRWTLGIELVVAPWRGYTAIPLVISVLFIIFRVPSSIPGHLGTIIHISVHPSNCL